MQIATPFTYVVDRAHLVRYGGLRSDGYRRWFLKIFDRMAAFGAIIILSCYAIAYFPGGLITDSINQLEQVRGGWVSDWHPPLMVWIWRGLEFFLKGPLLMFIFQVFLFYSAVWRLGGCLFNGCQAGAAIFVLLTVMALPVSVVIGVVWKDAWSTAFLAWAVVFLSEMTRGKKQLGRLVGAFSCCFAAMLFRHNAVFAVLPLFLWGIILVIPRNGVKSKFFAVLLSIGVSLGSFALSGWINSSLVTFRMYPEQSILLFDIAGIAANERQLEGIERLSKMAPSLAVDGVAIDAQRVIQLYRPMTWTDLVFNVDSPMRTTLDRSVRDAMVEVWKEQVTKYPDSYLRHRLAVFLHVLAWGDGDLFAPTAFSIGRDHVLYDFAEKNYGDIVEHYSPSYFQSAVRDIILDAMRSYLCRPWFILCSLFAILLLLAILGDFRFSYFALGSSAIFSELALFFIAPSADYRYSHWMMFVTWCFIIVLLIRVAKVWLGGKVRWLNSMHRN